MVSLARSARRKGIVVANELTDIPDKKYFTISETSVLCGVKPYVLRFWEKEFAQLKPVKRKGNRRYYQHADLILLRTIRKLLYEDGFTIEGAMMQLSTVDQVSSQNGSYPVIIGQPKNSQLDLIQSLIDDVKNVLNILRTKI